MTDLQESQETLDKIVNWVKSQGEQQTDREKPWKWITGFVVAAVAMFGIGLAYWRARKQGKELAKLKHEKDVTEREIELGKLANQVARSQARTAILRERGKRAEERITEIDENLKEKMNATTRITQNIHALKNWDDVDRYLSGGGNGSR